MPFWCTSSVLPVTLAIPNSKRKTAHLSPSPSASRTTWKNVEACKQRLVPALSSAPKRFCQNTNPPASTKSQTTAHRLGGARPARRHGAAAGRQVAARVAERLPELQSTRQPLRVLRTTLAQHNHFRTRGRLQILEKMLTRQVIPVSDHSGLPYALVTLWS